MLDRLENIQLKQMCVNMTEEEYRVHREVSEWAFNSHYWVEELPNFLKCKWCKRVHGSLGKVEMDYPLCTKNPALKKLLEKVVDVERSKVEENKGQHY